jgi:hypothetical protein
MIIKTKPDYINKVGTKWWVEKSMLKYCKEKDLNNLIPFAILTKSNKKLLVLFDKTNNEINCTCRSTEIMFAHIDLLSIWNKQF